MQEATRSKSGKNRTDNAKAAKSHKMASSASKSNVTKAKDAALSVADTVANKAEHMADNAISETRDQADRLAESGKNQTEDLIRSVGRAIEAGSKSLEDDGMARTASYVRAAANGLDRAASEVDGFDATGYTSRIERVVRNNPLLTVGALAIAGFAMAGAIKKNNSKA